MDELMGVTRNQWIFQFNSVSISMTTTTFDYIWDNYIRDNIKNTISNTIRNSLRDMLAVFYPSAYTQSDYANTIAGAIEGFAADNSLTPWSEEP